MKLWSHRLSQNMNQMLKGFLLCTVPHYSTEVRFASLFSSKSTGKETCKTHLCLQGRNPYNFWFIFWEKRWLHKFILKFTDLYHTIFNQVKSTKMQGVSREVGNLFMIAKAVFLRSENITALVFGALSDLCLVPNIAKYVLHFFFFFLLLRYMQAYNIAFLPKEKKSYSNSG